MEPGVLFATMLAAGLLLLGAEIFVPGGVLGVLGALALLGAAGTAFAAFGPVTGAYVALGILVLAALSIALWLHLFPRSRLGRHMTLTQSESFRGAAADHPDLVGREGTAQSNLRPSGYALVDGRRLDVISEGGPVSRGEAVRVIRVEGSRIVVRKAAAQP